MNHHVDAYFALLPAAVAIVSAVALAQGAKTAAAWPFFAMDTGTRDANHKTAESQTAMLKELGYAGIGPTYGGIKAVEEMFAAVDKHGLKMFALYVGINIDGGKSAVGEQLKDAIKALKGRETFLWLYVTSKKHKASSTEGDEEAVEALRAVADLAQESGVKVALYPHTGHWVERVDDAVRMAEKVGRKNLGVTFNLCHWLKVDGKDLEATLKLAMPHLFVVTVNGADIGGKDWKQLIQTLDRGTYDVGAVLSALARLGYTGPIGLQHYGIGGDAHENLKRSIDAWRRLSAKVPAGTAKQ